MYPILLEWGDQVVIPSWHVFYVLGAFAAYFLLIWLARRHEQVSERDLASLFITCYVAGCFGARLLSIFVEEHDVRGLGETLTSLARFGPMTFYGGAIGSFLAGLAFIKWRHLPAARLVDIGIPSGLLALAVGRLGCFLNGDDYGRVVSSKPGVETPWWTVTFPNLGDGLPRYPVQLIEAGSVLLLVLGLIWGFSRLRRAWGPGVIGFLGIVAYAQLRFVIEFWRDDFRGSIGATWLSTSQFISLVLLTLSAGVLPFWLHSRKKASET